MGSLITTSESDLHCMNRGGLFVEAMFQLEGAWARHVLGGEVTDVAIRLISPSPTGSNSKVN